MDDKEWNWFQRMNRLRKEYYDEGYEQGKDQAQVEIDVLKKEIEVLRQFGNKICTAMADEYLDKGE